MRLTSIILGLFFLWPAALHAQDFAQFIKGMRKEYDQSKALEIIMDVLVYDSAQRSVPYYKQTIEIKRAGDNYWYQTGNNEMLLNEKYLVIIDKEARLINYSSRNVQAESSMQKGFQFNLDSILRNYDNPECLGKEGDAEHFLVKEKKGPIEEIHFFIAPQGYILRKMEYKYRAGQHVSIRFVRFNKQAVFNEDTFSESRYLVNINNKMIPSRFFKQYEINHLR